MIYNVNLFSKPHNKMYHYSLSTFNTCSCLDNFSEDHALQKTLAYQFFCLWERQTFKVLMQILNPKLNLGFSSPIIPNHTISSLPLCLKILLTVWHSLKGLLWWKTLRRNLSLSISLCHCPHCLLFIYLIFCVKKCKLH